MKFAYRAEMIMWYEVKQHKQWSLRMGAIPHCFQVLFSKWAESELSGKLKLIIPCVLSKHYFINIFHSLVIFLSRIIMSIWVNILCAMNKTYLYNLRPGRLKAQQDVLLFNPNSFIKVPGVVFNNLTIIKLLVLSPSFHLDIYHCSQ